MPKLVDHDQRRAELVRVVWDVISRDGIEGATVRKIAEQANISIGGLRHYFDSQRGLLLFAAKAMADKVTARIAGHLHGNLPGRDRALLMLEELLPLDADRRVDADVWLACLMRSRFDASLAELHTAGLPGERHICRLAVAYFCGQPPPERIGDPLADGHLDRQARRLHTFIDGLTLQAAMYPREFPAEEIRRLLHDELAALFPEDPGPAVP
ncbi:MULTISPECIES: TetR/AcrR family transcriptional regulator [Amycolatopsis]|uniref:TetR family transcriptional regulator C-terminal domain-containing protein n=1 Tax=Amycolatopsis thermalba TaxID=944492 RepID=A0ABY4P225_9PSEU|nr:MULTISPECIES: TetR family transcriptional regulator C-terminal domain-containing protein [Amycolatopsis]OXM73494.1 TetR family transcriptional regulator [Amycolatopsis sp. KNN50.9b]UQS26411.1 TetR family transcriptional regulator C-terminal domain-containing protein [Amycolatopsis thermalba]